MLKALVFVSRDCPYCKRFEEIVERLKKELDLEFEMIDVEENTEAAARFNVFILPTLVLTKNGEPFGGFMGYVNFSTALNAIKDQISDIVELE
jgi:thiol-disulfide isomerase/thioredoxin